MIPKQLPDITTDKGIQKECYGAVKSMLQDKQFTVQGLSLEIEDIVNKAMLQGMQSGLELGWSIGQKFLLEYQKIPTHMTHSIKILPGYYSTIRDGLKPFEDLLYHRRFRVGRRFSFREWTGSEYTGREITFSASSTSEGCMICHIEFLI